MDIKELLDKISQYDEMESQDGMNLLEAQAEDAFLGGKEIKSELFGLGIGVKPLGQESALYLGGISYGPQVKKLSTTDYAGEDAIADVAAIVEKHLTVMEEEIKALLNLI